MKRKTEPFIYDPEKKYDIADFENATIKNLYEIGNSEICFRWNC